MASRLRQTEKRDSERSDDEKEEKLKSVLEVSSDDDDDVANEDLSLKIVEKHLLMRAAKLSQNLDDDFVFDENKNDGVVDLSSSSLLESEVVVTGPSGSYDDTIVGDVKSDKKRVRRKKKKIDKTQVGDQSVVVTKEEEKVEIVDKEEEKVEIVDKEEEKVEIVDKEEEKVEIVENGDDAVPNSVEISNNSVLRKLLRGPRYFDPPDSSWQTCYNCGEEGHMAVNCPSASKRKKPCFVCGSFDHGAKQCSKAQDCFICKNSGHRAKDCPEKYKGGSQNSKICLKCGDSGHDMFSCRNGYSLDDLKEIQCYICKSFGHLCCVDYGDTSQTEVSCYKCGQLGHTGLACNRLRGETNTDTASPSSCYKCGEIGHFARECVYSAKPVDRASPSSCYKCGEMGHFARECENSAKVRKRNFEESTSTLRYHRETKDYSGIKSTPHDLGKGHKRRKPRYDDNVITTPRKSKQRGGWITDDPGDLSYEKGEWNRWNSPATPSSKGHKISAITTGGHISSSQSSKKNFHHRFSASRFDNFGSDGIWRDYDW